MTAGRRLGLALGTAAALILAGRGAAVLYTDHAWYDALGASSVWRDEVRSTIAMYAAALVVGTGFALANMTAVRRSVLSLIVPQRVANVEFGEEIPSARLRIVTLGMSVLIAAVAALALPRWTTFGLWRSGVTFGELDPYLALDLGHYVAWLPVERAAYDWATVLFAIVALVVVFLYSLTPSLQWSRNGVHATTHARRHIAVLGGILVLLAAWSFRLAAFDLLVHGNGAGGAFTRTDHVWLMPANVILSIVCLGAALTVVAAGWIGQTALALVTVTVVLVAALLTRALGPAISAERARDPSRAAAEQPYADTRAIYAAAAFPKEPEPPSTRYAADSTLLANAGRVNVAGSPYTQIVFPGASGDGVVTDPRHVIAAPRLGTGVARWLDAWALQNPRLVTAALPADAAVVRRRDVRERVAALAPVLAQSRAIGAIPSAEGIVWVIDLYAASASYPLSGARPLGPGTVSYAHHAATAYVSGGTGEVAIVPDPAPDPIARAWFTRHRGSYLTPRIPPSMIAPPPVPPGSASGPSRDAAFRELVRRIYERMRSALRAGDLRAFGAAFDSLGALVKPGGGR